MAIRIADHYIPQPWDREVGQMADNLYGLLNSGAVQADARLNAFLAGPGQKIDLPLFQALDSVGDANVSSDDLSVLATPKKISAKAQSVARIARNDWFAESDFAAQLATVAGLDVVMERMADSAAKSRQACILAMLKGAFGGALSSLVKDVSADVSVEASRFNIDTFADALADIFDGRYEGNEVIIAHPKVVAQMQKEMGASKVTINVNGLDIAVRSYANHMYFLDRQLPVTPAVTTPGDEADANYTTYVIKPGAIMAGSSGLTTVFDDAPRAGNGSGGSYLGWREHTAFALAGVSYKGAVNPTLANLETAANWEVISTLTDLSKIGVGAIVTN